MKRTSAAKWLLTLALLLVAATALVVGVTLAFGLAGALWCCALFFPIGIVLFLIGSVLGWFD